MNKIDITVYRWAGAWGPFRVKIPCGECTLTKDVIQDSLDNELAGIDVKLTFRDWLSEWWKPLKKGGWHAPIVMVNGSVVSQGEVLNRGLLTQVVSQAYARLHHPAGNHIYGKSGCPYCVDAKRNLDAANIAYHYHDVVKNPAAMYTMISWVKAIIGNRTPVTVPQVWIEGSYVGGSEAVTSYLAEH